MSYEVCGVCLLKHFQIGPGVGFGIELSGHSHLWGLVYAMEQVLVHKWDDSWVKLNCDPGAHNMLQQLAGVQFILEMNGNKSP